MSAIVRVRIDWCSGDCIWRVEAELLVHFWATVTRFSAFWRCGVSTAEVSVSVLIGVPPCNVPGQPTGGRSTHLAGGPPSSLCSLSFLYLLHFSLSIFVLILINNKQFYVTPLSSLNPPLLHLSPTLLFLFSPSPPSSSSLFRSWCTPTMCSYCYETTKCYCTSLFHKWRRSWSLWTLRKVSEGVVSGAVNINGCTLQNWIYEHLECKSWFYTTIISPFATISSFKESNNADLSVIQEHLL